MQQHARLVTSLACTEPTTGNKPVFRYLLDIQLRDWRNAVSDFAKRRH
jgi:hypothetical protein